MPATRYYIDSNCISYCLWPLLPGWTSSGLTALRRRVFEAVNSGEFSIVGSQFHLEEASRIGPAERSEWVRFFWDAVKWNLLLPTVELAVREAREGRPLLANEPYDEYWRRQQLRDKTLRRLDELDALAALIRTYTANAGHMYRDLRDKTKSEFGALFKGKSAYKITQEWWADAGVHVADWMIDYMRASRQRLGLPDDEARWPTPRSLQTAWAMHSYQMARIVMTVGLGRKVRDSDVHDAHHFAMANYADVLVTQDGDFRDTIALIPGSLTVVDFDQFAARLGVSPH